MVYSQLGGVAITYMYMPTIFGAETAAMCSGTDLEIPISVFGLYYPITSGSG